MSSVESSVQCFCKKPAKSYSTKKGKTFVRCGATLDYGKIGKKLKKLETKKERRHALEKMKLGCNMNLNMEDAQQLDLSHDWCFNTFPKCEHDLYAKLSVSHSKKNEGKFFWSCPVQYPDIDCGFFEWAPTKDKDKSESESDDSSSEDEKAPKTKKKAKKISKRKRKRESSDDENSSGSESEEERRTLKKNRKNKNRKA